MRLLLVMVLLTILTGVDPVMAQEAAATATATATAIATATEIATATAIATATEIATATAIATPPSKGVVSVQAAPVPPRACVATGASGTVVAPAGTFLWAWKALAFPGRSSILVKVVVKTTFSGVQWGCLEASPSDTFLSRKAYLDGVNAPQVFVCFVGLVEDVDCDGTVPTATPTATKTTTATKTATAIPPTRTATATKTATKTTTPSRTATMSPTATAIVSLRADTAVVGPKVIKPLVGNLLWCRTYQGAVNTIRIMAVTPFYGVSVVDCGLQTKPPYNSVEAVKSFLEFSTGETWTIVR